MRQGDGFVSSHVKTEPCSNNLSWKVTRSRGFISRLRFKANEDDISICTIDFYPQPSCSTSLHLRLAPQCRTCRRMSQSDEPMCGDSDAARTVDYGVCGNILTIPRSKTRLKKRGNRRSVVVQICASYMYATRAAFEYRSHVLRFAFDTKASCGIHHSSQWCKEDGMFFGEDLGYQLNVPHKVTR